MRVAKIPAAVIAAIVMGSTPVSSLDVPSNVIRHDLLSCTASDKDTIRLVGAQGAVNIALISSHSCDD